MCPNLSASQHCICRAQCGKLMLIMARENSIHFSLLRLYQTMWTVPDTKISDISMYLLCAVTLESSVPEDVRAHTPQGKWYEKNYWIVPILHFRVSLNLDLFSLGFPKYLWSIWYCFFQQTSFLWRIISLERHDEFLKVLTQMHCFLLDILSEMYILWLRSKPLIKFYGCQIKQQLFNLYIFI